MRRTPRLLAPPLLAALLLGGCTTPDPTPTPPRTTDAAPVFASDEEALAAAEEAYGKYIATVDAILADGGATPERLEPLVSDDLFKIQAEGFRTFETKGWHSVGETSLTNFTLQQWSFPELTAYVCADVSDIDVIDDQGISQVSETRPDRTTYETTLNWVGGGWVVLTDEPWSGAGIC